MAIDVSAAQLQSAHIQEGLEELNIAVNVLNSYRGEIQSSWKGDESAYIIKAIDQTIEKLRALRTQMTETASTVVSTAKTIAKEEQAAKEKAEREAKAKAEREAKARAEKEAAEREKKQKEQMAKNLRVSEAQRVYDEILAKRDEIQKALYDLEKRIKKASPLSRISLSAQKVSLGVELNIWNEKLADAEKALAAAKR